MQLQLVNDILRALCARDGLPVESAVDPGKPARNYELADRLGIGHVFVRDCQLPCDGDCEIAPVHCWNWHRPNHKPDWHDPANCDKGRLRVNVNGMSRTRDPG